MRKERHQGRQGATLRSAVRATRFLCNGYEQFRIVIARAVDFLTQLLSLHHLSRIRTDGFEGCLAVVRTGDCFLQPILPRSLRQTSSMIGARCGWLSSVQRSSHQSQAFQTLTQALRIRNLRLQFVDECLVDHANGLAEIGHGKRSRESPVRKLHDDGLESPPRRCP